MCPILDTQGELALTPDEHLLFAVNAGSNSITSFRATSKGLKPVSVVSSGGVFPNSLTIHGNLLYVLNANSLNISGFRVTSNGELKPINGSSQALVGGALMGLPRQIGFDTSGKVLMVTLLANMSGPPPSGGTTDTIDTFLVSKHGVAGPGTAHNSTAPFPFAFAFDPSNHLVLAEVGDLTPAAHGKAASFNVTNSGGVTPLDTEATNGTAPCWVVITTNGRYAYVVNTGGGSPTGATVSEYTLAPSGKLALIGMTTPLSEFARTDVTLSRDDHFLYVLSPLESGSATMPGGNSHIDIYAVHDNGTLSLVGATPSIPVPGLSGLVGR
jgi:6-phosphogluconolactonase (cycloisomerase 2 family)